MAEELIDSYVDRNGVKGDTDYILAALREVYAEFKKLETVKIDLKGATGLAQSIPAINQAKAGMDSLSVATDTVSKRIAQMNGSSKEFTQVLLLQTKAQKEAANASLTQAKAANESAKAKQIEARLSKEVTKEIDRQNKERQKELKNLEKLNNEYEQLKAKYTIAANTAKQLAAAKGLDNEETKEAIAQAQKYYSSLINIEKAVGQNQRNVGNYTQATFALTQVLREAPAFANSFSTGISAISNNLPMLIDQFKILSTQTGSNTKAFGILAKSLFSFQALLPLGFLLVQAYGKEIGQFFSNLFSGGKSFNAAAEAQRNFNKALAEGTGSAAKTVAELQALYKISQDNTQSLKTRREATERVLEINAENNKSTGEQNKLLTDQNGILKEQPKLIDKVSQALIRQAKTKAALSILEKAYSDLLQKQMESLESQTGSGVDFILKNYAGLNDKQIRFGQQKLKEKAVGDAQAYVNSVQGFISNALKSGELDLTGIFGGGDTNKGGKGDDDKIKKAKELADRNLEIEFELQKIKLQQQIDFNKELADNEEKSLFERLAALRQAKEAELALIFLQYELEKRLGDKNANEILLIEEKKLDAVLRLERTFFKKRSEIKNQELKQQLDEEIKARDALEKEIDEAYKRFQKQEEERTKKLKEEGEKRKKLHEDEVKLRKQLEEQLVNELTSLTFTLFTSNIEREKNALQEQIDLLEERKQKEIEVANQTITNTEERAAAIAIIEARANAQREQLQRRQRDLDIKKAQFDKAQSIARIVQETAKNIVEYFGTPLAILAGVIGAAQLASVIAQPIPRYKHGKNVNDLYEGPAIVGDGGRREAIVRDNGSIEITPDTPTLTYVRKRDVVLPDVNMLSDAVISGKMGSRLIERQVVMENDKLESAISRMENSVVSAIKKIPQPVIKAENILSRRILRGDNSNEYLNKNLQS